LSTYQSQQRTLRLAKVLWSLSLIVGVLAYVRVEYRVTTQVQRVQVRASSLPNAGPVPIMAQFDPRSMVPRVLAEG